MLLKFGNIIGYRHESLFAQSAFQHPLEVSFSIELIRFPVVINVHNLSALPS